ncbi:MAG: orotate phosphoribosyltransferase [Candidatus Asgardarchaeia archaeon]
MSEELKRLSKLLIDIGAIKFGKFKLTSGLMSPFYIDLRVIPSFPEVFDFATSIYSNLILRNNLKFDKIVGVPTAGIPIASVVAYKLKIPLIYLRKEEKKHGLRKSIEGVYNKNDVVVIIDDIATTGKSIIESAEKLRKEGLIVKYAIVLVDREQGATNKLYEYGISLISFAKITEIMNVLYKLQLIDKEKYDTVIKYVRGAET